MSAEKILTPDKRDVRVQSAVAFVAGLIFALGLGISGMTLPQKVIGFLDVTGAWDYSLAFVMGGAVVVYGIAYQLVRRMEKPRYAAKFHLPTSRKIDWRLLLGAMLFGAGWGLGGFCPGPALVSLPGHRRSSNQAQPCCLPNPPGNQARSPGTQPREKVYNTCRARDDARPRRRDQGR